VRQVGLNKALKILLALAIAVASYFTVALCAYPFYDSWTDIALALANWSAFGYLLTPITLAKAVLYSVVVGVAVTALVVSATYIVHTAFGNRMRRSK
jgi:hypothetical protein